ncbi:DUF397 domain-containing protein [Actinocatenispora sera]|uniref:DUF397 domain-containing protein n=1 Tax=Actinocatenispora sera TaxID=390989 RepID=A0A810L4A4_9ACTN|nr:DUF397 domain-containing protein [Actinocatenispora sera]BCJ29829.1 DUF397 domain-containing protein [Actinocatenispora sera]
MGEISWRKSTRSGGGAGNNCVEVGTGAGPVLVRDTKDRDGGTLSVSPRAFRAFVAAVKTRY